MALRQLVEKVAAPSTSLLKKFSYPRALGRTAPLSGFSKSVQLSCTNKSPCVLKTSKSVWEKTASLQPKNFKRFCSKAHPHVIDVQDASDFRKRVLNSHLPVVVDFYADWCGPCKLLVPKLENLVSKHRGKLVLAKVNIEEQTELADEYQVMAVPTVMAMKNGKQIDKFVGFKNDDALDLFVDKLVQ